MLRPLPLALAALVFILLVAGAAAGPTRALTDVIVNLAGGHPSATPTPHSHSEVRSAPPQVPPTAAAAIAVTPVPATPAAYAGPAVVHTHRVASGSRTMAPLPLVSSQPVSQAPAPSPVVPDTSPNGSDGQGPSPTPATSPSSSP